jgi:CRISPR system Cascade subunit CasA
MTAGFDLTTERWIPVVDLDGAPDEVSLREVLLKAHTFRRIVGETPPMTAALYRLVLAVLHRAYGPEKETAWGRLWSAGALPDTALAGYLDGLPDRFDLFHPQRPFLQCAALSSVSRSSVAKLVPHKAAGNNVTLFDHTTSQDRVEFTPAEAARWLVTAQAFDPGGMKTPYEKDKASERSPCSTLGVVVVEGATLRETLLLNAVVYAPDAEKPTMTTSEDAPAWESEPPPPQPGKRDPRGWTDLLTWPSRRVLLFPESVDGHTVVAQAVLTPGTRMTGALPDVEMMAAFRKPNAENGKPKLDAPLVPVRLHPVRGIWRHSVELLAVDLRAEERTRQRPRALKQIADLMEVKYVPADTVFTLRVFGQQLDSKASVVEGYLEDEVLAPLALVRASDDALAGLLGCAVELADEAGAALRSMQRAYLKDMRPDPPPGARRRPDPPGPDIAYWPTLTQPFAVFLRSVNTARLAGKPEARANRVWRREVLLAAECAAQRWAVGSAATDRSLSMIGKAHGVLLERLKKLGRIFDAKVAAYVTKDGVE